MEQNPGSQPTTPPEKTSLELELEALQALRDELKLKLHLAAADARDEYHRLEKKWERFNEELQRTASHTKEPLRTLGASAKTLLHELTQTYERIRPAFRDPSKED